jgi:predicted metalloprotease with PDZ domain
MTKECNRNAFDLKIRYESGNKKSLDDVMRTLYNTITRVRNEVSPTKSSARYAKKRQEPP